MICETYVAGVKHRKGAQEYLDNVESQGLDLVPEPDNPHDRNAIKVMHGDTHVGYVPANECEWLLEALSESRVRRIWYFQGPKGGHKMKIEYDRPETEPREEHVPEEEIPF